MKVLVVPLHIFVKSSNGFAPRHLLRLRPWQFICCGQAHEEDDYDPMKILNHGDETKATINMGYKSCLCKCAPFALVYLNNMRGFDAEKPSNCAETGRQTQTLKGCFGTRKTPPEMSCMPCNASFAVVEDVSVRIRHELINCCSFSPSFRRPDTRVNMLVPWQMM